MPVPTLRTWFRGWPSGKPPILTADGGTDGPLILSFFNVVAARFLSVYRQRGVSMQRVVVPGDPGKSEVVATTDGESAWKGPSAALHGIRQRRKDDMPPAPETRRRYRSSAVTNTPPRASATA